MFGLGAEAPGRLYRPAVSFSEELGRDHAFGPTTVCGRNGSAEHDLQPEAGRRAARTVRRAWGRPALCPNRLACVMHGAWVQRISYRSRAGRVDARDAALVTAVFRTIIRRSVCGRTGRRGTRPSAGGPASPKAAVFFVGPLRARSVMHA